MKKPEITQDQIMEVLNVCYEKVLEGIPNTKSPYDLASEYILKYPEDIEKSYKNFVKWQIAKCTTSGFLTSLGGLITLPVAIPANLASVWYVQLRMIATIAIMGGYEPSDDMVRTLAYVCLAGTSVSKMCRDVGVQFTNKLTISMIQKIPGSVLTKINQRVGFRFLTKFGSKGLINLGKLVPVAGGLVGAGIDFVGTQTIAKSAYKTFILNDME